MSDRLEKYNKELDSVIVASVEAPAGLPEHELHEFRGPQLAAVRGRDEPVAVHYLPRDASR